MQRSSALDGRDLWPDLAAGLRAMALTLVICAGVYPAVLLLVARALFPAQAEGSLMRDRAGQVRGSRLVAQGFAREGYLWPRPSACGYDAAAASGSNLAPSNPALRARALEALEQLGATAERPAPAELVAASGSGLDPHVTLAGALYQAERVARARGVERARVVEVIEAAARRVPLSAPLVVVLEANLALDEAFGPPPG